MTKDEQDRWTEIRFYYFCLHTYQIRFNMMDLMYAIETMSQLDNLKVQRLKAASGRLIGDISQTPLKEEVLYLATLAKVSPKEIKKAFGYTARQMRYYANSNNTFYCYPRSTPEDMAAIRQFMTIADNFKGGII